MFPNAHHQPATCLEQLVDYLITRTISAELLAPVRLVGLWCMRVEWATVPKTPVDENGNAFTPKYKVGPDTQNPLDCMAVDLSDAMT
jgi:hypothetical protein